MLQITFVRNLYFVIKSLVIFFCAFLNMCISRKLLNDTAGLKSDFGQMLLEMF